MFSVFTKWLDSLFADEEAILLLLIIAGALALIVGLSHILAPVITSVVLAYLLDGLIVKLRAWRVPAGPALVIAFSLFLAACAALTLVIMPMVWKQAVSLFQELPHMVGKGQLLLTELHQRYPELITEEQFHSVVSSVASELTGLGQLLLSFSLSNLLNIVALSVYAVLVPILIFFMLKDKRMLLGWFAGFLPENRPMMRRIWEEMDEQVANYIRGKVIEIVVVGGVTFIAFSIMGLNYAALLALLVGLSVLIPYIGAAVVTVPVTIIAYLQWGPTSEFIWLFVVYAIIQALDGNILVPLLFSEAVNLHPVAIILAVLFFGSFWGLWGVFFAIPLATLVKALINAWPRAKTPCESPNLSS
ncbi:putative permease [Sinobacterium caligoides]|uniref:Putative permease n=1 Tax=Sinobacterium caligoides TaxID=933926 RepID=A0A3N2E012_9GAMM|nr:AI-2E family transporter [Sinobacterium caligoides]ROS05453.1 putative permease [Sinobacterium caligoides]